MFNKPVVRMVGGVLAGRFDKELEHLKKERCKGRDGDGENYF